MKPNLYQRAKKGARGIALAGLALTVAGCTDELRIDDIPIKLADLNGYNVSLRSGSSHRFISIDDQARPGIGVYAYDWNGDNRFDEITLKNLPVAHPLELYANPDSLNSVWNRTILRGTQ